MPATADRPKEAVLVNVSYERLKDLIIEPLDDGVDAIEILDRNLCNALGHFDGTGWEARFESPPTFADIGSLAVRGLARPSRTFRSSFVRSTTA